jgi:hypothetical protein
MILTAATVLHPLFGQETTSNALPPGVTAEMEKDFLARYGAAIMIAKATKNPGGFAAYHALYAMDPAVPPDGKKAFEEYSVLAFAMDAIGGDPSYSFVPVSPEDKSKTAPLTLAGKAYTRYPPPVVTLKTTFAPPEHPDPHGMTPKGSSHPLCVENGRLMFIGIKPAPGVTPAPVDNPADNYGLTPNHLKDGDTDDDQDFTSLEKFLAALNQPGVRVLDSGKNDYIYYALCRVKPGLFVFAQGNRPGKENFAFMMEITDSNHGHVKSDKKPIILAEDPDGADGKAVPIVQGDVYYPGAGYTGPINVVGRFGDEMNNLNDKSLKPSLSKTVDWK